MEMEIKAYPLLECKADDVGKFTGYASTYAKDAYGDRIAPGAFAQSIRDRRGKIPIFYDHQRSMPVGFSSDLAEDAKGLYIAATLSMKSMHGANAYALLQTAEDVDYKMGLSIGFIANEVDYDDSGRVIKSLELFETSLTPFPVNRQARVETFKSIRNIEQILRDVGGCSTDVAKRCSSLIRPYLPTGVDGESPAPARDVRGQQQAQTERRAQILRAVREGLYGADIGSR